MKNLIVIPTYNEAANVEYIINKIKSLNLLNTHILIIDDNSSDGTQEILSKLKDDNLNLSIIERDTKSGFSSAILTGFQYAIDNDYDYVITLDADGSHDPNTIIDMLDNAEKYDLIIGSRYSEGIRIINWNIFRLSLSYFGNRYLQYILSLPVTDYTSGYKCYNVEMLKKINLVQLKSTGYAFQIEINYRIISYSARVKEIPIIFNERILGKSKFKFSMILEAVLIVLYLKLEYWLIKILNPK